MASNPRINSSLVSVIRFSKVAKSAGAGTAKVVPFTSNKDCPENAFRTERAKKTGKANAASGRIYVTVPSDHFGLIPAENDPIKKPRCFSWRILGGPSRVSVVGGSLCTCFWHRWTIKLWSSICSTLWRL